jgi:hypothetical protein
MEHTRGFLCHVDMTYLLVTPYLKGFHLTLAAHSIFAQGCQAGTPSRVQGWSKGGRG